MGLFKILKSNNPYSGIVHLKESGLMQEILPELIKCFGIEQKSPNRHHIYDVGTHLLMSLKECKSTDPVTRFATLIHDIGKPQTVRKLPSGVITFYNHEMVSTRIAENIADRLKFSSKEKAIEYAEKHYAGRYIVRELSDRFAPPVQSYSANFAYSRRGGSWTH
ncbi:MAG: hypothetical protein RLZZ69_320 [Cyanobacteriota bacterium]